MKKKHIIFLPAVLLLVAISSCTKSSLAVKAPSFNATVTNARSMSADTVVLKVGDTAKFALSGNPDNITFYSGENGKNYLNRNRVEAPTGQPVLQFTSYEQWGSQKNTLRILATNSLTALDSTSVVNASWTDITTQATLSTGTTGTPSGIIDLTPFKKTGTYTTIAFKYTGQGGSTQRTWTIQSFNVQNILPNGGGTYVNETVSNATWTIFSPIRTPANSAWIATNTQLQVVGGGNPTYTTWAVAAPVDLSAVTPDVAVGLKNITNAAVTSYNYKYVAAGLYQATFLAFNVTPQDEKTVMKQIWIRVTP